MWHMARKYWKTGGYEVYRSLSKKAFVKALQRLVPEIRPEDVELSEVGLLGDNVWEGRVAQKVFLGEALDFQVTVGARTLLSRQHPTLRTKVGEPIFVRLNPEKCVVLKIA